MWGIHRGPVNSPHKGPVTRKMFPFDDVIMYSSIKSPASKPLQCLDLTFTLAYILQQLNFLIYRSVIHMHSSWGWNIIRALSALCGEVASVHTGLGWGIVGFVRLVYSLNSHMAHTSNDISRFNSNMHNGHWQNLSNSVWLQTTNRD